MKKNFFTLISFILLIINFKTFADTSSNVKKIYEGKENAKVTIIVYESLTCGHCADFHKNVYPDLKKEFIDTGLVKIEFRNFPLDMAALNASKIAHCKNDGKSNILHFLFENQKKWAKGDDLDQFNSNLKEIINKEDFGINFDKCLNNKKVEDHILEDRIEGVKKFEVNSTPTIIINDKKFDKPLNYKNLKKTIKKLI
tara:strand:- start:1670 stop:2263 length:594 start_codon:yes stop_codon:yes gene_type:complete